MWHFSWQCKWVCCKLSLSNSWSLISLNIPVLTKSWTPSVSCSWSAWAKNRSQIQNLFLRTHLEDSGHHGSLLLRPASAELSGLVSTRSICTLLTAFRVNDISLRTRRILSETVALWLRLFSRSVSVPRSNGMELSRFDTGQWKGAVGETKNGNVSTWFTIDECWLSQQTLAKSLEERQQSTYERGCEGHPSP